MKIQFRNSYPDVVAFHLHMMCHSPLIRALQLLTFALVTMLAWKIIPDSNRTVTGMAACILFGAAFVSAFFLVNCLLMALIFLSTRKDALLTDRRISLGNESFMEESFFGQTVFPWETVQKLARTRHYIYLFISQYGTLVIPRRAFETGIEREAFYAFCQHKITSEWVGKTVC